MNDRPPNTARRALTACAAAATLCLACAGPAVAAAPSGWLSLSQRIAAPWPALQDSGGHFRDYVVNRAPPPSARDDYGDAMLGYGLLGAGIRDGDRSLIDAGLAAVTRAAKDAHPSRAVSMFRYMAVAGAYNLARAKLAQDPGFAAVRAAWESRLEKVRVLRLGGGRKVTNKSLVEAVEILELARSGLHSTAKGTILNDPTAAVALVRDLLKKRLPATARPFEHENGAAGRLALVGDFTELPLAYHALAVGFLARAVNLMGSAAPKAARKLLARAVNASWALAGPDGDLAYIGRSQEQAWTLALTASAAETAAPDPAGRYRALAERAVGRLDGAYRIDEHGLLITPALGQDLNLGLRGLDYYVAAASYNGLTLVGLDWALERAAANDRTAGRTGADSNGSFAFAASGRDFATVRRGDVWFAVKQAHLPAMDLRYDFGLAALEVRGGGAWHDVLPLRPRVENRVDSAGPTLIAGGSVARPEGRRLKLGHGGKVTIATRFRTSKGRVLRDGVPIVFRPTACGVSMSLPVRAGDGYQYSGFFTKRASPPQRTATSVADETQRIGFDREGTVALEGGYFSDADADLVRARIRFSHLKAGHLTIETCRP